MRRLIRDFDDTKLRGVISEISSEIDTLKKIMDEEIVSSRDDNESIMSQLKEGNEKMGLILARLDDIDTEIQEMRRTTWYSRLFCV